MSAQRFRKKPVVVEAMLWDGTTERIAALSKWSNRVLRVSQGTLRINTLEGTMTAQPGDWIIRGVQGEFYPCRPDIFEATYEADNQEASEPADISTCACDPEFCTHQEDSA